VLDAPRCRLDDLRAHVEPIHHRTGKAGGAGALDVASIRALNCRRSTPQAFRHA
jgi:hypothetical protein